MGTFAVFKNGGAVDETGWSRPLGALFGAGVVMKNQTSTAFQGTQHAGSANMSVDIQIGDAQIFNSNAPNWYWVYSTTVANATVTTAHPSLNRLDTLVVYVDESVTQNVTYNNPGAPKFMVVPGTASGSPAAPNNAAILTAIGSSNPYLSLANIAVAAGVTQIFSNNITDVRVPVTYAGKDLIIASGTNSELVDSAGQTEDVERFRKESGFNFIASGCVWTPDAAGSTLNGSMTSGVVYIGGRRLTVASISGHAFTASKDTYVDFQDAGNGTATVTFTAVTNNATSPALANSGTTANTIRNGIIISGASNIAAQSSINQGTTSTPVVSSAALLGADSLGNIIYPRGGVSTKGLTNPCKFLAYRNAAQSQASGVNIVPFDALSEDTGANFSVSTHLFTAPVPGSYCFQANVMPDITASSEIKLILYKNGNPFISGGSLLTGAGTNDNSVIISTPPLSLVAGDTIGVYVNMSATAGLEVGTAPINTWFGGYMLSAS